MNPFLKIILTGAYSFWSFFYLMSKAGYGLLDKTLWSDALFRSSMISFFVFGFLFIYQVISIMDKGFRKRTLDRIVLSFGLLILVTLLIRGPISKVLPITTNDVSELGVTNQNCNPIDNLDCLQN